MEAQSWIEWSPHQKGGNDHRGSLPTIITKNTMCIAGKGVLDVWSDTPFRILVSNFSNRTIVYYPLRQSQRLRHIQILSSQPLHNTPKCSFWSPTTGIPLSRRRNHHQLNRRRRHVEDKKAFIPTESWIPFIHSQGRMLLNWKDHRNVTAPHRTPNK